MYALAEKYDMPDLKSLAIQKFAPMAKAHWPSYYEDSTLQLIEDIYSTTPSSDRGLQNIAVEACKRDVREKVRDKDRKGLMDKYEDFRNDMMDIAAKKMAEEAKKLESLKAKLDDVRLVLKRFRGVMEEEEE